MSQHKVYRKRDTDDTNGLNKAVFKIADLRQMKIKGMFIIKEVSASQEYSNKVGSKSSEALLNSRGNLKNI